jgi:hypothetical protein
MLRTLAGAIVVCLWNTEKEREKWVGGGANGKREERGGTYGVAKGWRKEQYYVFNALSLSSLT